MLSNETTLVVGAIVLLALIVLAANSFKLEGTTVMLDTEASITAISIAQTMIDEMQTKDFDEKTIGVRIYAPSDLTPESLLGPEGDETVPMPDVLPYSSGKNFDDIDDYIGYQRIISSPKLGKFSVFDSVCYVNESNLNEKAYTQTVCKMIVVKVTHRSLKQPVVLKDVMVYRRYY